MHRHIHTTISALSAFTFMMGLAFMLTSFM